MFPNLNAKFVTRLSEQAGVAALGAFAATLAATTGSITKAVIVGAVAAGVRAAYGVLVQTFGDPEQPSVK